METVNAVLGGAGAGMLVRALDQEWTVPYVVQRHKTDFEAWMIAQALNAVLLSRQLLGEASYQEQMDGWRTDAGTGKFRWQGLAFRRALNDLPGMVRLGWIL